MAPIKQIDAHQVKQLEEKDSATIVDIRDPASFKAGHIPNAIHLSDGTVEQFFYCPYCGENISIVLDLNYTNQLYTEDCVV